MREKCGIFAAKTRSASKKAYYSLLALQHRGQESAGISTWQEGLKTHKGLGLVSEVFKNGVLNKFNSNLAIGHVRYSTFGGLNEAQPLEVECCGLRLALVHNGTLTNYTLLRKKYEREGFKFNTSVDSEILGIAFLRHYYESKDEFDAMSRVFEEVKGAYSVAFLFEGKILVARDPIGFRPLSYGFGDGHYFASESSSLRMFDLEIRDVKPGEVFVVGENVESKVLSVKPHAHCVFEYIYFARPDSVIEGRGIYKARLEMGRQLAREDNVEADVVIAVPDSGRAAAIGYSSESGVPYEEGLIKNRYIGRTFIMPKQELRDLNVQLKLSPVEGVIKGKRVILIDDSIVRGTTMRRIVAMLKKAGAREVHVRIASPPIRHPCYMGIDIPSRHELIASWKSVKSIEKEIGADSLRYLSIDGLVKAVGLNDLCLACLNGVYPKDAFDF
ncbi:amidophosphoribosyltransferase [Palaeococcus pacificus DY20341]|uniref:Amidophosphoribosyltransferase n=1 Tax=Palaeococcus pacificus DY20341 TaxID=1343739 RepID=A0A075LPE3_9EURY|nr:amidophosphoribosyltransferase [Palaeococcus pacificus]AIF68565.1 amidophosphoribosyltransferase [Palaeococcus pacificus DY20341]